MIIEIPPFLTKLFIWLFEFLLILASYGTQYLDLDILVDTLMEYEFTECFVVE